MTWHAISNLDGTSSITAVTIENSTYALVASFADGGSVEIVRLHSPLLSIIANNTHPLYAKTGDSLSIEFTVNNTIASSSASILESGLNQTIIQIDRDFKATVIVPSTQRESYANFNINVTDTVGETLSITEDDLPSYVSILSKLTLTNDTNDKIDTAIIGLSIYVYCRCILWKSWRERGRIKQIYLEIVIL